MCTWLCVRRSWQDTQGRGQRARHAPHPRSVRPVLLRGAHRVQGPRWVHGHRAVRARS